MGRKKERQRERKKERERGERETHKERDKTDRERERERYLQLLLPEGKLKRINYEKFKFGITYQVVRVFLEREIMPRS